MGDSLGSLSVKELKQLENRLDRGITRIRSKKVKIYSFVILVNEMPFEYMYIRRDLLIRIVIYSSIITFHNFSEFVFN